jgi:hypothetical protein
LGVYNLETFLTTIERTFEVATESSSPGTESQPRINVQQLITPSLLVAYPLIAIKTQEFLKGPSG